MYENIIEYLKNHALKLAEEVNHVYKNLYFVFNIKLCELLK